MATDPLAEFLAQDKARRAEDPALTQGRVKTRAAPAIGGDDIAENRRIAERYGVPAAVVSADPDRWRERQINDDAQKVLDTSPKLGAWVGRDNNAALSKDDLAALSVVENALGMFQHFSDTVVSRLPVAKQPITQRQGESNADYWRRVGDAAPYQLSQGPTRVERVTQPVMRAARNTGVSITGGLADLNAGLADTAGAYLDLQEKYDVTTGLQTYLFGGTMYDAFQSATEGVSQYYRGISAANQPMTGSFLEESIYEGVRSIPASASALALGLAGSPAAGLGLLGTTTGGSSYRRGREAGLGVEQSILYGGADAAVEIFTERLPFLKFLENTKVGTPFFKRFLENMAGEQVGEQAATALQDLNAWAVIEANQGKTFSDYLAERPEAALRTAIATAVAVGATNTAVAATEQVARRYAERSRRAQNAQRATEVTTKLQEIAQASKLQARDVSSFENWVNEAADGTDATDVFVEANTLVEVLNQSGLSEEQIIEALPSLRGTLAEAMQANGDVQIPIGEFAARSGELGTALIPHLRIDPNDLSQTEAAAYLQSAQEELQAETAKALDEAQATDEIRASAARVQESVLAQLNAAGRFTEDTNTAYAALHAQFFTQLARDLGVTPEEAAARYPLWVQSGETPQGEGVLDQPEGVEKLYRGEAKGTGQEGNYFSSDRAFAAQFTQTGQVEEVREIEVPTSQILTKDTLPLATNEQQMEDAKAEALERGFIAFRVDEGEGEPNSVFFLSPPAQGEGVLEQSAVRLAGLPSSSPGPFLPAREAARQHSMETGLQYDPPTRYAKVDVERAKRIAQAFEDMAHNPNDPLTALAYQAMIDETLAQWELIKRTGLEVEFIEGEDPYDSPWGAVEDVRDNNHLYVFPTDDGFGSSNLDVSDNPLLKVVKGEKISGKQVRINDIFRIVHDYFGHVKEGVGFRATGEENAWRMHSAMYTPLARRAMTTETRGQNSWVNYGPYGDTNRTASGADTVYAPQKIGLLPEWVSSEGATDEGVYSQDAAPGALLAGVRYVEEVIETPDGLLVVMEDEYTTGDEIWKQRARDEVEQAADSIGGIIVSDRDPRVVAARDARRKEQITEKRAATDRLTTPPVDADGMVELQHWSRSGELQVTDPARWGQSGPILPSEERARINRAPARSYFGIGTGQKGGYVNEFKGGKDAYGRKRYLYTAKIPAESLYDMEADPAGLRAKGRALPYADGKYTYEGRKIDSVSLYETMIADAGYVGYWIADPTLGLTAAVFNPTQVERSDAVFDQSGVFYSALERGVEGIKMTRAPAAQWIATIQKLPGIKQEELEWTGVLDWLAAQEGPIEKADIEVVVRAGGLVIEETVLTPRTEDDLDPALVDELVDAEVDEWLESFRSYWEGGGHYAEELNAQEVLDEFGEEIGEDETRWRVAHQIGGSSVTDLFSDEYSAQEAADVANDEEFAEAEDDYRRGNLNMDAIREGVVDSLLEQDGEGTVQFADYSSEPESPSYRELLIKLPAHQQNNPRRSPGTHWDESGVIAHARFNEKKGPNGERILFIEEIQSDWHQEGREQGYEGDVDPEKIAKAEESLFEAQDAERTAIAESVVAADGVRKFLLADEGFVSELRARKGEGYVDHILREGVDVYDITVAIAEYTEIRGGPMPDDLVVLTQKVGSADRALSAARNATALRGIERRRAESSEGIPDAPFKESWPMLTMKRMIAWGAENGYDQIAWIKEGEGNGGLTSDNIGWFYERNLPNMTGKLIKKYKSKVRPLRVEGMRAAPSPRRGEIEARLDELNAQTAKVAQTYSYGLERAKEQWEIARANVERELSQSLEQVSDWQEEIARNEQEQGEDYQININQAQRRIDEVALRNAGHRALLEKTADWDAMEAAILEYKALDEERKALDTTAPTNLGFDITPEMAEAATGGFPLFQRTGAPRGQAAFAPDITQTPSVITLLRGADLSTFLHESGHYFLEVMVDVASREGAPDRVTADLDAFFKWSGVKSLAHWKQMAPSERREHHERFARGFEAYLYEGKAPSEEARGLFGRFRSWLLNVYKALSQLNVEMTDEVRGVFDRMLASEAEIMEAEQSEGYAPIDGGAPEGVDEAAWREYQELGLDATREAVSELEQRSLRDMKYASRAAGRELKKQQAQIKAMRDAMRKEVEADLVKEPLFRAQEFMRRGNLDGQPVEGATKIDIAGLEELYADDPNVDISSLKKRLGYGKYGLLAKDGVPPAEIAELFGFTSADHLVQELLLSPSLSDAVEAETDVRLVERYGDLNSPKAVQDAVDKAIHNDVRGRFIATGLAAMTKAPGKARVMAAAAKSLAERAVARVRIRDLRPSKYDAAERRAGKAAAKALAEGNLPEAAAQTRSQLVNFHGAKATREAQDDTRKALDYLKKFGSAGVRKNLPVEYLDQIDKLLERFDLRIGTTNRAADRRKALVDWVQTQQEMGLDPVIDEDLLNEARALPWRELTVEEIKGLRDTVKNIEHLGRLKQKLLTAKDNREFADAVADIEAEIMGNAYKVVPEIIGAKTWFERVRSGVGDFFAMHRKLANLVFVMDGNKHGAGWKRLIQPMNEAGDREAVMNEQATIALGAIFRRLGKQNTTKRTFVPELGVSLSLEDRLMFALNMGNEANLQRLMDGDRLEQDTLNAVLAPLTREHWQFVQEVWDYVDSFWPQIKAKEERVAGLAPEKVEATPFERQLEDGTMISLRGGYFPIKYDPDRSSKAEADQASEVLRQMTQGKYANAQTRRGHTKARAEEVDRPLRKDFGVIFEHVSQVIHDLSWHEYLIDANRLLGASAVDSAIRASYGPNVLRWMRKALEDIAVGDLGAQNVAERAVNHLRVGVTVAGLGWNLWTSLLQPVGLTQSMSRIGTKWVAKGIARITGDAAKLELTSKWVYERSDFMRLRAKTMQREINEIRNQVSAKSPLRKTVDTIIPSPVSQAVTDSYFVLIAKAQLMADLPTWIGQYEKSMDAHGNETDAAAQADQAVIDSQGGGQIKDLAGIQRGGPLLKLWTNFYSYFSVTYNLVADRTADLKRVGAADLPYFAVDVFMLTVLPSTITTLMYQILKGDDDDWEEMPATIAKDNVSYLLGLMVGMREIGAALTGDAGYRGPAGARIFAEVNKASKQISQGELDEAALRSANSVAGIVLHYPSGQVDRTVRGIDAIAEGEAGPLAPVVGPPAR